jgi:hypothetical protein
MRLAIATFLAATTIVATLASPALARPSNTGDEASKPPCYGYEQNPDGSWRQIPCLENGVNAQPHSKVSVQDAGKTSR